MRTYLPVILAVLSLLLVCPAFSAPGVGAHRHRHTFNSHGAVDVCDHPTKDERKRNSHVYLNRATLLLAKGNFELAISELDKAIRLNPGNVVLYRVRGKAHKALEQNDLAIVDFSEAIRLNPNDAAEYTNRGTAYQGKHDIDDALADYDMAIRLNPTDPVAYFLRSGAYEERGELDLAIADYGIVIHLKKKDPLALVALAYRGEAYEVRGDFDRAIADYGSAIRLDPRDSTMDDNRGNAYQINGDFLHAIKDFDSAIRINSADSFAYRSRGIAYFYRGFLQQAYHDFKTANELDPRDAYAALWLDVASYRTGRRSSLPEAVVHVDMSKWPAPVIRRYLDEITAEALRSAAEDLDPSTRSERICEANFYDGALALRHGSVNEALSLLRAAGKECPKNLIEWIAANAELTALEHASR